jgi:hypothetical protein
MFRKPCLGNGCPGGGNCIAGCRICLLRVVGLAVVMAWLLAGGQGTTGTGVSAKAHWATGVPGGAAAAGGVRCTLGGILLAGSTLGAATCLCLLCEIMQARMLLVVLWLKQSCQCSVLQSAALEVL